MFQYHQNQFCKSSIIYYRNCIKKGCHKNHFLKYFLINVHGLNPQYFQNMFRSSHRRCSVRKGVLRIFTKFSGKHLCQRSEACNFIKKETLARVFSCEFREISENSLFYRTHLVAASHTSSIFFWVIKINHLSRRTLAVTGNELAGEKSL